MEYCKIEDVSDTEIKNILKENYDKHIADIRLIEYFGEKELIEYRYGELTALCPMTGIQDLYEVVITFVPDKFIPELKSLKLYFLEYRNLRISHELLCSKIYKDFKQAVKPKELHIELNVSIRGGIRTCINIGDNL